jgi:hypothetical protein
VSVRVSTVVVRSATPRWRTALFVRRESDGEQGDGGVPAVGGVATMISLYDDGKIGAFG